MKFYLLNGSTTLRYFNLFFIFFLFSNLDKRDPYENIFTLQKRFNYEFEIAFDSYKKIVGVIYSIIHFVLNVDTTPWKIPPFKYLSTEYEKI